MLAFILRRLAQAVLVMLCVALIAFMLFQFVGDPVSHMLGQDATQEQIREARDVLGLNNSIFVQFWHFLSNAVQGEFGFSLRQGKVSTLVAERFPATLELALSAAFLALCFGIPMGVYAALQTWDFRQPGLDDGLAAGGFPADLPDRHCPDPDFFPLTSTGFRVSVVVRSPGSAGGRPAS